MFRITRKAKEAKRMIGACNSCLIKHKPGLRLIQSSAYDRSTRVKFVFGLAGATVVGLGGVIAYAKYDPKFRMWIVDKVPFSKSLGLDSSKEFPPIQPIKPKPISSRLELSKQTKEPESKRPDVKSITVTTSEVQPSLEMSKETVPETAPSKESSLERLRQKEDEELHQRLTAQEAEAAAENAALTQILKQMTDSLHEVSNSTIASQQAAVSSLRVYIEKMEDSLDVPKHAKESALKAVSSACVAKNEALKTAQTKMIESKELIEKIRTAINRGRDSRVTVANQEILTSEDLINSITYRLQSLESQVENAKSDALVINDYREMVEKAQKDFQAELKSLIPEVKAGQKGPSLTESELNQIIAHAHKRVEQLQKQLALHQASEKHRFQQALDRQKQEHERKLDNIVALEGSRVRREMDSQLQHKLVEMRDEFEQELRMQLRRQAAAHSDHLKDVVQMQKTELQENFKRELDEKLGSARSEFEANLSKSYARLQGIEEGLKARADLNNIAKTSQSLWLASQSLKRAIEQGDPEAKTWEEQLKPLGNELKAIKESTHESQRNRLSAVLNAIPETVLDRGIYPQATLKERFLKVYRVCQRVTMIEDEKEASLLRYALSYLQSMLLVERASPLSALELKHQPIDPKNLTAFDVLTRARWCVERDDLELALRYMNLLRGAPRAVASDWMNEVRMFLEVRQVADVLSALSAAEGIQCLM